MKTTEKPMAQAASANEMNDVISTVKNIEVLVNLRIALNESLETSDDEVTNAVKSSVRKLGIFDEFIDELPTIFARAVHTLSKLHEVDLDTACSVMMTRHDGLDYIERVGTMIALMIDSDNAYSQAE